MTDTVTFSEQHKKILQELMEEYASASPSRKELIKRAAALATWCEGAEAAMALGSKKFDMAEYNRAVTTLRQLLEENKGNDDFAPQTIQTPLMSERHKARMIAWAVGTARREGRLHHLGPEFLEFVPLVPPETNYEAHTVLDVTPVASNDNPKEYPEWPA